MSSIEINQLIHNPNSNSEFPLYQLKQSNMDGEVEEDDIIGNLNLESYFLENSSNDEDEN